ncbi:MAG: ABC transporter ATP-binding protein [Armatimonadota bacterium]
MIASEPVLAVEDLHRHFAAGNAPLPVLQGVSFQLGAGERMAIVGPSGSGKSTLLHCIALLDVPDSGRIRILNRETERLSDREAARLRADTIGIVFQSHHLLPQCTARENLLVPVAAATPGKPGETPEARADRLLARVDLAQRSDHRPAALSGGECQRVALARALVNRPALLLADEPTGALDRRNADSMVDLLCEVAEEEGTAMLVITHSDAVAKRIGNVHRLEDGRLVRAAE